MHAGKKFNTHNEGCMNIGINKILPVYLLIICLYIMCNKIMLTITQKFNKK